MRAAYLSASTASATSTRWNPRSSRGHWPSEAPSIRRSSGSRKRWREGREPAAEEVRSIFEADLEAQAIGPVHF